MTPARKFVARNAVVFRPTNSPSVSAIASCHPSLKLNNARRRTASSPPYSLTRFPIPMMDAPPRLTCPARAARASETRHSTRPSRPCRRRRRPKPRETRRARAAVATGMETIVTGIATAAVAERRTRARAAARRWQRRRRPSAAWRREPRLARSRWRQLRR